MLNLFGKTEWVVVNCLTGEKHPIDQLPFEIGAGEGADLRLRGTGVAERHGVINQVKGEGLGLIKQNPGSLLRVNGESIEFLLLLSETDYALAVGPNMLALHGGRHLSEWLGRLNTEQWTLHDAASNRVDGPMSLTELCQFAREQQRNLQAEVRPAGLTKGFLLAEAMGVLAALDAAQTESIANTEEPAEEEIHPPLTCPVCWLPFDIGDMMHLATHDSLRGDPVLGEDAPQRFLATRFNDRGQALDALGLPCTEYACPHCRRVLPPGFIESTHHIISLVGDQSAGKSYYLSVLLKQLPASLYENFSVVFQDSDPAGNAAINEMKQILFGAETPEGARLVKTQLEGSMYVRLPRYGRVVALPKPFVFSAASSQDENQRCSLIFYDNAGEHFQPGRDSAESPGAQHIASSAGILFLFDPFNNPDFRHQISDRGDPQLEKPVLDLQSVILSEMKVRLAKLLSLPLSEKIEKPLAMIVGKCDAWIHLLGTEAQPEPVKGGKLDLAAVNYTSNQVRELMKRLCPAVVANAESISRQVMYFPVSSFGHAPVKLGPGDYVPDPRRLQPYRAEVPMLWILSQVQPGLIPALPGA